MITRKSIELDNVVISKKDIEKFVEFLAKKYKKASKTAQYDFYTTLSAEIKLDDGVENSFKNNEVTGEFLSKLDDKKCTNIDISFYEHIDNKESNSINITLKADDYPYGRINIKSENRNWFNDTFVSLEEITSEIKPQDNYFTRNKNVLRQVTAVYFGFVFIMFNLLINRLIPTPPENTKKMDSSTLILAWIVILISSYIVGLVVTYFIFNKVDKLWPKIEFDFGPKHLRHASKVRNNWKWITTVIVIPLLMSLIFFLLG